jgi:hypothetical protein
MLTEIVPRIFIFTFLFSVILVAQDDTKPWERLGLSQTEWRLIKDNDIKMSKVEELLKVGISIGEYLQKPWVVLNLTEDKWIKKRREGLTSYDIELEAQSSDSSWKKDLKSDAGKDMRQISGNSEMFASLFLPGYYQYKTDQNFKGTMMVSLAGGAVIWCTIGSIATKKFEAIPVCFLLVPDMIWSFIDYKIAQRKAEKSRDY